MTPQSWLHGWSGAFLASRGHLRVAVVVSEGLCILCAGSERSGAVESAWIRTEWSAVPMPGLGAAVLNELRSLWSVPTRRNQA
jgi:hypothetical protein